ncbi:hypothetical protein PRIC2_006786 [Phytophthora ramorum]
MISPPISAPKPSPAVPMPEGGDHEPSSRRATTTPVPILPVQIMPALMTVRKASPEAFWIISAGIAESASTVDLKHESRMAAALTTSLSIVE